MRGWAALRPASVESRFDAFHATGLTELSHWIDPTSLEAIGRAVDRIRTLGVFLIVNLSARI